MINKKLFEDELLRTELNINDCGGIGETLYNVFVKSQKILPYHYTTSIFTLINDNFTRKLTEDYDFNKEEIDKYNKESKRTNKLEALHTMNNFIRYYSNESELICIGEGNALITNHFIVYNETKSGFGIIAEPDFDLHTIKDLFITSTEKTDCILYAYIDSYGEIETRKLEPKLYDKLYYNADYPSDKVKEIMESDSSELILYHGNPGTGKSSTIKHMPLLYPGKQFIYIDSKIFSQIGQEGFTEFIFNHEGAVIILEDCEEILQSRDTSTNPFIKGLLNMTDGIFGDHIKCKFICTFNSSLDSIDKALLRKGRLSLIYEFKELDKEIVKEIFREKGIDESLAKPMSLADAWNYDDDNGNEKKQKRIGF